MRGVPLLAFTKTCANGKALVRRCTLCEVFDHSPHSSQPITAHLAAFILPSRGRLLSLHPPLVMGAIAATIAMDVHANHCGLRGDDVGTNRRSLGTLAVD